MVSEIEAAEKYLLLLVGVNDSPIPGHLHLQKEFFILSQSKPLVKEIFKFEKHYYGPYSRLLDEITKNPLFYEDCITISSEGQYYLSKEGKIKLDLLLKEYNKNPRFFELITSLKLLREVYDKLSFDELLFLIYLTYPDYSVYSKVSDRLLKDQTRRKMIASSLFKKGIITEKRHNEIIGKD